MPKLSKEEVITKLAAAGVKFDINASYNDLHALLKGQERPQALEQKVEENPVVEEKIEPVSLEEKRDDALEQKIIEEVKEKANPFSSFEVKQPLTGKAQEMRKKLMSQPRVPVMIPLGAEEKIGSTHQVTLNGYPMFIRKGQMVMVPLQVKEVLEEKFAHQMHVRQHPLKVGGLEEVKLQKFD